MALAVLRPLAFGEVLDQAFGLFRRAFVPLVTISLVCSGIPALLNLVLQARGGVMSPSGVDFTAMGLGLLAIVAAILGGALANGASTYVVSEQYLGRTLSPSDALRRSWTRAGSILATSITVGLLTGLGFLLLVVPGVIAAAGLSLAVTACAIEGLPSEEARARSWDLTKGFRWRMLGLVLIYGVILWIILGGVAALQAALGMFGATRDPAAMAEMSRSVPFLLVQALAALLNLVVNPILYCILIVSYYDLRVRKEAFDLDLLATTLEHGALPR